MPCPPCQSGADLAPFPVRVYYEDTDAGGIVYYANYLKFMERARTEFLRRLGFGQAQVAADTGLVFAVRSVTIEYLLPARLDDELSVLSRIESLGRAQLVFAQQVMRQDTVLVEGKIRVACLNTLKNRAAAMPREMHEKLNAVFEASQKVSS